MWKAYFNGIIRPVDRGLYPKVYQATLAIESEGLFALSQMTFHNVAPQRQPTSSPGCDAKEWQGVEWGKPGKGT